MNNKATSFYRSIFADLSIDQSEAVALTDFLQKLQPPPDKLVWLRAQAFRDGNEFLTDDKEKNCSGASTTSCMPLKRRACSKYLILQQQDAADDPLFTSVDNEVWKCPTFKAFHTLLDNYASEIGVAETFTADERRESLEFLNAICQTAPMQFCHYYCHAKDPVRVPKDVAEFKTLLNNTWFELYNRGGQNQKDSSGFEHVFVGEVRDGEVTGFHNWIQFYFDEKKGDLDCRGYLKLKSKTDGESNGNDHVLTLQFHWKGVEKIAGTFFVCVSPEFEMALYTMCFMVGEEENHVELNTGHDVFGLRIKCYRVACDKIGTAFPDVNSQWKERLADFSREIDEPARSFFQVDIFVTYATVSTWMRKMDRPSCRRSWSTLKRLERRVNSPLQNRVSERRMRKTPDCPKWR